MLSLNDGRRNRIRSDNVIVQTSSKVFLKFKSPAEISCLFTTRAVSHKCIY